MTTQPLESQVSVALALCADKLWKLIHPTPTRHALVVREAIFLCRIREWTGENERLWNRLDTLFLLAQAWTGASIEADERRPRRLLESAVLHLLSLVLLMGDEEPEIGQEAFLYLHPGVPDGFQAKHDHDTQANHLTEILRCFELIDNYYRINHPPHTSLLPLSEQDNENIQQLLLIYRSALGPER